MISGITDSERMLLEAAMVFLEMSSWHFYGQTKENREKTSVGIAITPAKIRSDFLPNNTRRFRLTA
jgi:hypothetical protein